MKHKVLEGGKHISFKAMAELLGTPYGTAHFRRSRGYSVSEALLLPIGAPRGLAHRRHGMHDSREYAAWERMHQRCRRHPHYVKLGIKVCDEWSDFVAFLRDVGRAPVGKSLDRIDSAGHYEPGNVRWATAREQAQNTSQNVNVTWKGQTKCAAEWAREVGLSGETIAARLRRGWTAEQALTLRRYARVL